MKCFVACAAALLACALPVGASARVVGPDSFGYAASDKVDYVFKDIRATGTTIIDGAVQTGDEETIFVPIGFDFNFYGLDFSTAGISANGFIRFGPLGNPGALFDDYENEDISTTQYGGSPAIFTFWDDLILSMPDNVVTYQTEGEAGDRRFIVQETALIYGFGLERPLNFQTVLEERTGNILMHYFKSSYDFDEFTNGNSATIGIQGAQPLGQVVQWGYNTESVSDGTSICYSRNAAGCGAQASGAVPEPATWAFMLLGFGVVGGAMRTRRHAAPRSLSA